MAMTPHPFTTTSLEDIKPYCADSAPPDQNRLIKTAATKARPIRIPEIIHQLTPTLDATADSINKLCENDSITAIIKTSFTVKSNEIIAAIPAYKFNAFPNTKGIAVSSDRQINFINWLILSITHGKTGVYCKNVTINVIGKITFPKVQTVLRPCCQPR